MTDPNPAAEAAYPSHWEAEVVLRDGGTAVIRPIRPDDAELLLAFYSRVSDQSKYFRFFAPYPRLSNRDVQRFTHVDHHDRVALIVTVAEEMIAVGRSDRTNGRVAEVAFLVEDAHQGRGVGSVLLEHLAQAARETGVERFVAEVLPENHRMVGVFEEAGYRVKGGLDDGIVHLELDIEPTATSLDVMQAREHRAEARSVERLLTPRAVAVVGASRSRDKVGQAIVRNLVLGGFTGPVYAVNPEAPAIAGVPAYASLPAVPGEVDLAIVAVPAEAVSDIVIDAAVKGVHGLIVVSSGFAETGSEGRKRQRRLVRLARAYGLRVIGPSALGVINTDRTVALNASLSPVVPEPGRVGFFCQSGALGTVILRNLADRGLGLSTFVSAGNRADVSGNDVMQYWEEDAATDVVLLYLESIGNPRKFSRIARRLSRSKPIVAVRSGRYTQSAPLGHTVHVPGVPQDAVDAMFRQAGVIVVDTLDAMLDVAQVLAFQPLPGGNHVGVVGNSDALALLAVDAAAEHGLTLPREAVTLPPDVAAEDLAHRLAELAADPDIDAVVVGYALPVDIEGRGVAQGIARVAQESGKPIVATFLGSAGVPEPLRPVPSYASPGAAVSALAHVTRYARWRGRPQGRVPALDGVDDERAHNLVRELLGERADGLELEPADVARLLRCYGIEVLPAHPVATVDEAIRIALEIGRSTGTDVVLKATAPHLRQRPDLADVRRDVGTADEMRDAWDALTTAVGNSEEAGFVVQQMVEPGVPVTIAGAEDPGFGPVVSFGVAGVATDLLGDRAYRIPPLTDLDAATMVREIKAAPLLLGHRGGDYADLSAIEDLLHRAARMAYDLPDLVSVELVPVLAGARGTTVLGASVRLAPAARSRTDWYARRLTRL